MLAQAAIRPAPLTAPERALLVRHARDSIIAGVSNEESPSLAQPTVALLTPTAAFVSLHHGGELRGCVGTLAADHPLHETVARMARSAALEDPRFPPLRSHEVTAVEIEISRLGPLTAARLEDIVLGKHGVCLSFDGRRAVFLPKVATLYSWDRDMLLTQLCLKATLAPTAWKLPDVSLQVFTAEVFGDSGAG